MALFDRASLVQIPSGYKEGKLYNIKPFDQPFEFERGSAATRVNEDGLIEQAGVSNTQLWNDDDVSSVGTGSYSNGVVTMTASTGNDYVLFIGLEDFEASNYYEISFEAVVNSGSFVLLQGNGTAFSPNYLINESGSYSRIVQYTNALSGRLFFWSGNVTSLGVQFDGTISNISIKKVNLDTPRIDYTNGKALLLEPQRTNLVTNSETFSSSSSYYFGPLGASVDGASGLAPDGRNSASTMLSSGSGKVQTAYKSLPENTTYTLSVWVKNIDATNYETRILANGGSGGTNITQVNRINEINKNYWTRVTHTFTTHTTAQNYIFYICNNVDSGQSLQLWGAQLEQGSYATSYIPTNGQTETRLQDVCQGGGNESTFNDSEGVLYVEILKPEPDNSAFTLISINNADGNSDNNTVTLGFNSSNNFYFRVRANSTNALLTQSIPASHNQYHKLALKYKSGDLAAWINGVEEVTSSNNTFSFAATLDNLSFDYNGSGGLPFYGNIKTLAYFPEALTDTELQELTTI